MFFFKLSKSWVIIPTVKCLSRILRNCWTLGVSVFLHRSDPVGVDVEHPPLAGWKHQVLGGERSVKVLTALYSHIWWAFVSVSLGEVWISLLFGASKCRLLSKLACSCWVPCLATVAHDHIVSHYLIQYTSPGRAVTMNRNMSKSLKESYTCSACSGMQNMY